MFGVFTGARRAEILGLQWRDIDWNHRTARIERTWRRGTFYSPKTKASRRTVELPDELVDELRRWKVKCPKGANDFVFPAPQVGPTHTSFRKLVTERLTRSPISCAREAVTAESLGAVKQGGGLAWPPS